MAGPRHAAPETSPDVVVVGGGIAGVAAAAHIALTGRRVLLLERDVLGAGASGRNSGIVQNPLHPALEALHLETLELYRRLDAQSGGALGLPVSPAGLLSVSHDPAVSQAEVAALSRGFGHLAPTFLDASELRALEPAFGPGVSACRLEIGYPVRPIAATRAYGGWARTLGVEVREGVEATPWVEASRVQGVRLTDGSAIPAADVVVAAGHASPRVIDPSGRWRPIRPLWGLVVTVELPASPSHVIEEAASAITTADGHAFSLVTAGGATSLGSVFLDEEPDPATVVPSIVARGASFMPGLATAPRSGWRVCARPLSRDGLPLVGRIGWVDGLWIVAGHGPWGISTGPASARVLADLMEGTLHVPPTNLDPTRFGTPG